MPAYEHPLSTQFKLFGIRKWAPLYRSRRGTDRDLEKALKEFFGTQGRTLLAGKQEFFRRSISIDFTFRVSAAIGYRRNYFYQPSKRSGIGTDSKIWI